LWLRINTTALAPAVDIEIPAKFAFLYEPSRYKVVYGGRDGAKSWNIAIALLLLGAEKQVRIMCAREIQKSIADSVHHLLVSQIARLGLDSFYEVQKADGNVLRDIYSACGL
jgi:phage terminase large subunit